MFLSHKNSSRIKQKCEIALQNTNLKQQLWNIFTFNHHLYLSKQSFLRQNISTKQTHTQKSRLTAERGFVRSIGTVWGVVTHPAEVNTHAVPGALPLPAGTAEGGRGTVALVAAVSTVVISVTYPAAEHTVAVIAAELRGGARARRARVMLVRSVFTVRVPVTFPVWGNTAAVWLALELTLVVTHARRSGGWRGQRSSVE